MRARELIEAIADSGTWASWDEPVTFVATDPAYVVELAAAREATGLDEAVTTGTCTIRGHRVAAVVSEFDFLAGSIGVGAADRLVAAIRRATAEGLPLVASPASGGTRMQEGTVAFVQMLRITEAIAEHRTAGLPFLLYLRNPTTGGVFASWGSLGHVIIAEPGALIGFLGPRVYEALYGEPFPAGVQRAENLFRHGLIDAVVTADLVPELAERALNVLTHKSNLARQPSAPEPSSPAGLSAWESIERSRRIDRPGIRQLLRHGCTDVVPLHGTQEGERGTGLLLSLARFGDIPAVVLGQDRRRQETGEAHLGPGALRAARRGMRLAEEMHLPLVTVIDTPGAALSKEAEEGGLAGEIARSIHRLITLTSPTLAVLLGQGTGGGALALLPTDRVIAAEHAWLSPLPPEGASAIVFRTTDRAAELAARQQVRSIDLLANGIVDRVVDERPDAADEPEAFIQRIATAVEHDLWQLTTDSDESRAAARRDRYRSLGMR